MATCKCGTFNEYQDEPYVCRDCREGVVAGVDPGAEPGTLVYMNGQRSGKSAAMHAILKEEMTKMQEQFADAYAAGYFDPKGASGRKTVTNASPAFFGVNRDEEPVRLARTCAPWEPDAAAVAAVEKKILDLVTTKSSYEVAQYLPQLRRDRAELLFSPDARLEVQDAIEDVEAAVLAARDAIEKIPEVLRKAYWTKFYCAVERK